MKFGSCPVINLKWRRFRAWRSWPIFRCLGVKTNSSPKTRVTRSMRRLEGGSSGSEPVAGPSGLQQTSRTGQGSDGRVLSGKRKREDEFELEQERAGPGKKCRTKTPRLENISNERKTPGEDSAEEKEESRGLPSFRPVPAETMTVDETARNYDDVFAKYQVIEEISAGGFGVVYAGLRIEDDFPVAIKVIEKTRVPFVEMKVDGVTRKLPKEVALLILLGAGPADSSCNITPLLLDWYDLGDEIVLVLERPEPCMDMLYYVMAADTEDVYAEAKIIFRQLVELAIEMEAKGVFHMDIKPGNVLIETGSDVPRARFIDFGCGTIFTPGQRFNQPPGTPQYASPEWFRQSLYTARPVTVWQLGLVLYFCLFHKRALVRAQSIGSMRAVPIPRTAEQECRDLLRGCLEKDPDKRLTLEDLRNHPWLNPE